MLLAATDLTRTFGGVRAVGGVSLHLDEAEIVGLVGANGSGKTTCLNMLTRLIPASSGSMRLDGVEYSTTPPSWLARRGVSRTFQNLRLFTDLTVRENVALGVAMRSGLLSRFARSERLIRRKTDEVLEFAGIAEFADVPPGRLPYGTQRVVEIARAVANAPRLMFLDEPFAGMSTEEATAICALLLQVRANHATTLLIVDHNIEVLVGVAERLVALAEGRVIAEGSPQAVMTDHAVVTSYVGADD